MAVDMFGNTIISPFRGEYAVFSNFSKYPITLWDTNFPTTEHAYQWRKTIDPLDQNSVLFKEQIGTSKATGLPVLFTIPTTASEAKAAGKNVALRPEWNEEFSIITMTEITIAKVIQHPYVKQKLQDTGESLIVEGNTWHDNFWGDCTCGLKDECKAEGRNNLGKVWMKVRTMLPDLEHPIYLNP